MPRTFTQLVKDRLRKQGLYDSPAYWDMKAESYEGLARSNWPSNSYNREVHRRQMDAIDAMLGGVRGLTIADVGCGTGRASIHLAGRGAKVVGWDFAPKAVAAAEAEARQKRVDATFRVGDVRTPPPEEFRGAFDVALVIGCLTLACKSGDELDAALANIVALAKPGGRVLFIEPIHDTRLFARILRMSEATWTDHAERAGLKLLQRRGIFFVPARYALAFRDLPHVLVGPTFEAGERLLGLLGEPETLSDYKVLLFRRSGG